MYRLEDINENVTSYGNHNKVYTIRYIAIAKYIIFLYPNRLTDLK